MNKISQVLNIMSHVKNFPIVILDFMGLAKENYIVKLRNGLKLWVRPGTHDKTILKEIFITNDYKLDRKFANNRFVVFDIGANIGMFSISVTNKFKSVQQLEIYSFEPEHSNFSLLTSSIALNGIKQIHPFKNAVSYKSDKLKLFKSHNTGGHTVVESNDFFKRNNIDIKEYEEVDTISLPGFMKEKNIEKIDFLKMDIEGGEYDILFNLDDETYNKIERIAMEYHFVNDEKNGEVLQKHLENKGYNVRKKYPMLYASRSKTDFN